MCICFVYGSASIAAESASNAEQNKDELFIVALGEYQHLNEKMYLGAIYLPLEIKKFDISNAMRLEMRIAVQETSARRFTRMWMDSISLNASREQRERLISQIQAFSEIYQQNLHRGDRIAFEYNPEEKLTLFFHNDIAIKTIPGEEFFNLLLNVWIGDRPISTEFKNSLFDTAARGIETFALDSFYILDYEQARQNEIELSVNGGQKQNEIRLAEEARQQEQQELEAQELARLEEIKLQEQAEALAEKARQDKALEDMRLAEEAEKLRLAQLEEERIRQEEEMLAKEEHEQEQMELRKTYKNELMKWLSRYVVYPEFALRRGIQGRVEIRISGDRNGNLLSREIILSSGVQRLDKAAHDIVLNAAPLPSMPSNLEDESISLVMPIAFILDK